MIIKEYEEELVRDNCRFKPGLIKVNGRPLELVEPRALSYKLQEPILLLGKDRFVMMMLGLNILTK